MSILATIEVDDQGSVKLVNFTNAIQGAGQAANNANQQFAQGKPAVEGTKNALDDLGQTAQKVASTLALLAGGRYFYSLLKESGELSARIEVLGTVIAVMAKNSRNSAFEMEIQAQKTKALGITTKEAYDAVIQFAQANLKMADTSNIARAAQDLAVVAGMNSSQAFGTLTTAIQMQQPILLRHFGIVKTADVVFAEYARTIGKTVKELDGLDKKQAFVNMIIAEGKKVAGAYEAAMGDVGKQMTSFARYVEDAKEALGESLLPVMMDVVKAGAEMLKMWTELDAGTRRVITAILAGVAAMTVFAGVLAGAKFLGAITLIKHLIDSFGLLWQAIRMGSGIWQALILMMGGPATATVLAVSAAVGGLVAAYIYLRDAQKNAFDTDMKELGGHTAKAKSFKELTDRIDVLGGMTARTAKETDEYNKAVRKLEEMVPGVVNGFDQKTKRWDLNTAAIKRNSQALLDNVLADKAKIERDLARTRREVREAQERKKEADEALKKAREDPRLATPRRVNREETAGKSMKDLERDAIDTTKALHQLEVELANMEDLAQQAFDPEAYAIKKAIAYRERTLETFDALGKSAQASAALIKGAGKEAQDAYAKIQNGYKTVKDTVLDVATGKMVAGPGPSKLVRYTQEELEELARVVEEKVKEYQAKLDAAAKRYKTDYENMMKNLKEDRPTDEAQFKAVIDYFKDVAKGTDEYAQKLQIAAPVIEKFAKAGGELQKRFAEMGPLARDLAQIGVEKVFRQWALDAALAAEKIRTSLETVVEKFNDQKAAGLEDYARKMWDEEKRVADGIYAIDRDLYERTVVGKMNEVDQKIYANNKYYEDTIRANDRQIEAIERMMDVEKERVDTLAGQAIYELQIKRRQADEEVAIELNKQIQIKEIAARESGNKKLLQEAAAERLRYFEQVEARKAMSAKLQAAAEADLRASADNWREQVALQNEAGEKMIAQLKEQNERLRAGQKQTNAEILLDYQYTYKIIKQVVESTISGILNGFAEMLVGARSFKDVFIGIWQSIKATLLGVFNQILQGWIKMLTQQQTATEAQQGIFGATSASGFGRSLLNQGMNAMMQSGTTLAARSFAGYAMAPVATGGVSAGGSALTTMGSTAATSAFDKMFAPYKTLAANLKILFTEGTSKLLGIKAGAWAGQGVGSSTGMLGTAAGSMAGAGAGAYVGYKIGSTTGSYGKGMGYGAATGAGVGFMMGGPIGAGVGALAGLIAGFVGARKEQKATKQSLDEFIKSAGGLEKVKKDADEVGFSLDKMMSSKNRKDLQKEIDWLQKTINLGSQIKQLTALMGGLEKVREMAAKAGISLDALYDPPASMSYDQRIAEIEKIAKALELQKAKDGLAQTKSALWDLRKTAALVGFDLQQMYDAKTMDEFNTQQEVFNELLEKQRVKMAGLQMAAGGLGQMVAGWQQRFQKIVEEITKTFDDETKKKFSGAYETAQKKGYTGSELKFMVDVRKEGGLSPEQLKALDEGIAAAQAEFGRLGLVATATFAGIMRETGDVVQAMAAIDEPLSMMIQMQEDLGLTAEGAFSKLLQFRKVIKDNQDIANSLSGVTQVLKGLGDAGLYNQDLFAEMGKGVADYYQTLIDRGVAAGQAMMLAQPALQQLWQAQKDYGLVLDDNTQKLVDQAVEQGVVGEQGRSVNEKMLEVLLAIGKVLGADIPEGLDKAANATKIRTDQMQKDWDRARREAELYNEKAGDLPVGEFRDLRDKIDDVVGSQGDVTDGQGDIQGSLDDSIDKYLEWRDRAVQACQDVYDAEHAVAYGHSPGGLAGVTEQAQLAIDAFREFGSVGTASAEKVEAALQQIADIENQIAEAGMSGIGLQMHQLAVQEQRDLADWAKQQAENPLPEDIYQRGVEAIQQLHGIRGAQARAEENARIYEERKRLLESLADLENRALEQTMSGSALKKHQIEVARAKELKDWLEQSVSMGVEVIQRGTKAINDFYDYQMKHLGGNAVNNGGSAWAELAKNMNTIEQLRQVWGLNIRTLPNGSMVPELSGLGREWQNALGIQAAGGSQPVINVTLHNTNHVETNVDAMAAGDVSEAWRSVIAPAMIDHLETNTDQIARRLAHAAQPYLPVRR